MGYQIVDGDALRTRYDDAPRVSIKSVSNASVEIELVFWSGPGQAAEEKRFTRLRFLSVIEYRWGEQFFGGIYGNKEDFKFALIEITDSEAISGLITTGMFADQPEGQRFGGVIDERELRHFRIGFDDYGTFDVICLNYEFQTGLSVELPNG